MAEIINLRQARKNKARADKEARAAQNRVAFGRTKAESDADEGRAGSPKRRLDLHKRDRRDA